MEKIEMESCNIYYDSWQMLCCGEPFSVGDKIKWTCKLPNKKDCHGVVIDFWQDNHGEETHTIEGVVTKIIAERSESPKGEDTIIYDEVDIICDELQHAEGWESALDDDDTTRRCFWGYIIELKDVCVCKLD